MARGILRICSLVLALGLGIIIEPASSQISAPFVGLVRYADGGVYRITGVRGNYIVGERLFDAVDALTFSDAGGLLFRKGSLLLIDERAVVSANFSAPTAAAIVGIETTADSAIAWLATTRTLVHWSGSAFTSIPVTDLTLAGEVLSVTKNRDVALLLCKSADGSIEEDLVSLLTGSVISRSPVAAPTGGIFRAQDFTIKVQDGQLTLTSTATGSENLIRIRAKDVQFERMSGSRLHLHSGSTGRDWILDLSGDQTSLFELPPPAPMSLPVRAIR